MLLFSGTTSWFCWLPCCCWVWGVVPPGVMRIVLIACALPELEELDELDELLDDPPVAVQGCTATVWIGDPRGMMMRLEPSGGLALLFVLPTPPVAWFLVFDFPPWGQGGTITLTSLRCLANRTVRTPGVWSAMETMSVALDDEELLLELLLPHALTASATKSAAAAASAARAIVLPNP